MAEHSGPQRAVAGAWLLFSVSLFLVVTVGASAQAVSLTVGLLVTEVFLILLPAMLYVRLKRLPMAKALRWNPVKPGLLVRSAILGVLGWGMAAAVYLTTGRLVEAVLGPDPLPGLLIRVLPKTLPEFGAFLIVMAVLPGLCEETLFRGAIQATFEKKGIWKGVVYTAVLFGAYHMSPWSFLPAAALGLLFGTLTVRTNSTLPAIICHTSSNVTAFTVAFAYREEAKHEPYLLVGALALLFAAALAEFLYATRHARRQPSPLTTAPANLSRRFTWVAAGGAAGLAILLALALFAMLGLTGRYRMTTDHLAPQVNRGDHVLVLKSRYVDLDIQRGDVVAFRRDGHTLLRKVARVDDECIWVVDAPSGTSAAETRLPRREVIGKMIWKIRGIK